MTLKSDQQNTSVSFKMSGFRRPVLQDGSGIATRSVVDGVSVWTATDSSVSLSTAALSLVGDIREELAAMGNVLLRGFHCPSRQCFSEAFATLGGEPFEYFYDSTPRTRIDKLVYTSTEYDATATIALHNELSYTRRWPDLIAFYCETPPDRGGETPIGDSVRISSMLDSSVVRAFSERDLCYTRRFDGRFDVTWQRAFGTDRVEDVEERCEREGINYSWAGGVLRTSQRCAAMQSLPHGEAVWFNQAHLFHHAALPRDVQDMFRLAGVLPPRDVTFADGSPIPDAMIHHILDVCATNERVFTWQRGDMLLLDNMRTAHGRRPFEGQRTILVGMRARRA